MQDTIVNETIKQLYPLFVACPSVGFVYLFGSQAVGSAGPASDFDIAIFFDEHNPILRHETLFRLSANIARALGNDAVDIKSINDLTSPELKYHIIHDGILLYEHGPHRLIIEPRILNEYFDFTYLLRKYGLTKQPA